MLPRFAFNVSAGLLVQRRFAAAAAAAAAAATAPTFTAPVAASAATGVASPLRKVRVRVGAGASAASADAGILASLQKKLSEEFAAAKSCGDSAPAEQRPLTALQRRQLAAKDKLVFSLTTNAVYRIKTLMDAHNADVSAREAPAAAAAAGSGGRGGGAAAVPAPAAAGNRAVGIRVGVMKHGCSGYSYTVNYALESDLEAHLRRKAELERKHGVGLIPIEALDSHVEQNGVHVIVDGGALFYVVGTKMDYVVSNVEEKFEFANPNKKASCGCGESFMPEL